MSSGAKRPPAEVSAFAPAGSSPCKPKRRKQSTPVRISGELGPEPPLPPSSPISPSEHLLQSPPEHTHPHQHPETPESPNKIHDIPNEPYAYAGQFRYEDQIKNHNKENFLDPYAEDKNNRHDANQFQSFNNQNPLGGQIQAGYRQQHQQQQQHNSKDGAFYHKYRDVDKCSDSDLIISRVGEVGGDIEKSEGAYRNDDIENLNAYVIKNSIQHDSERLQQDADLNDKFRKINDRQEDKENLESSQPRSANDRLQESPETLERYNGSQSNERHPCGRCGLMFPSLDLLRLHFENEHIERNGRGLSSGGVECKVEPYDIEENSPRTSSGATPAPGPDTRIDAWSAEFQAKMADIYKNALSFPHDMPKESMPPNFNPLCPPFPLFSSAVPPQRPLMEPIRIFNPEAYCELCSKEFCNKYFLKTHKANKHGIYENTPTNSGTEGLNLESSIMPAALASSALKFKNNMMLAEYAKSYEAALLASQRHKAKIQRMMEEARDVDKNNAEGQSGSLNTRPLHLDDVRSSSDDNTIPENFIFKNERHEHEETFMTPTPRKLSPDSSKRARESGFNTDTLRRLGVINPEAFCKICCKEYCNKYFLKTHKIKRHGLLPSPTEKYGIKEHSNQVLESQERKEGQTSPLNLIMGDQDNQDKLQSSPELIISKQVKNPSLPNNVRPQSTQSLDSSSVEDKKENSNEEIVKNENAKQSPTPIFISEDLQKLQTMISQLNDLSVNKIVECYVCKKEFENNYILQFHMMSDHGISVSGSVESFSFPNVGSDEMNVEQLQQKANCTICEKEFPSMLLLKKHIDEYHAQVKNFNDSKTPNECLLVDKEVNSQRERRASMSLTPTNSYCEICNKELCNKYFMKTHMQRMHGIEIENGTQIGGVICDICNKELCSKYFLRVHKHNTHGIVEPGTPLPQMRNISGEQESTFNSPQTAAPIKPPPEANILSNRFIAHFVEVCPFCSRRFRTSKWLKAHLLSDHGKAGIDKWKELEVHYKAQAKVQSGKNSKLIGTTLSIPDNNSSSNNNAQNQSPIDVQERMPFYSKLTEPKILNFFGMNSPEMKTYNCSYCPFSTSILSFLYVHEKSHAQGPEMDILCPMCTESFNKPEALQIHIITAHSLPEWKERPGNVSSPNRECQSRQQTKTPPSDNNDNKINAQSNGTPKPELFECYECDFKSCNFGEMELHLKNQHYAVRDGSIEGIPENDCESFGDDGRRKSKMPAIYAVPRSLEGSDSTSEQTSITMQPFVIEENTSEVGGGKFVPSVVFLPVRRKTTGMITISFNLTPA